jgi:predicted murein hydrolase (TIGR00659 family)
MNEAVRAFGVVTTVAAYAFALWVHRRVKGGEWAHPLLLTCLLLMGVLLLLPVVRVPLTVEDYRRGGEVITFFLGPATVALAVPLYRHRRTLARHAMRIAVAVVVGGLVGILSAVAVALAFRAGQEIVLSVMSKSVTTPIAVEITRALGGKMELAAAIVVCSGLLGAVVGVPLLRAIGIRGDAAIGLGMGTAAHGIGTSSVLRSSELQGTYAALAMALNGIFTAAMLTPAAPWIARLL